MELKMKRIYESPEETDGFRILVDRLWPRGVKKEAAQLDAWLKDSAPSPDLRKWFAHDPDKFAAFKERYEEELLTNPPTAAETDVTLVYAARDPEINHVAVLRDFVESQRK